MSQRRVVVTGLGCVSSVGNDVKTAWENVKNGNSGITKITLFAVYRKHLRPSTSPSTSPSTPYSAYSR